MQRASPVFHVCIHFHRCVQCMQWTEKAKGARRYPSCKRILRSLLLVLSPAFTTPLSLSLPLRKMNIAYASSHLSFAQSHGKHASAEFFWLLVYAFVSCIMQNINQIPCSRPIHCKRDYTQHTGELSRAFDVVTIVDAIYVSPPSEHMHIANKTSSVRTRDEFHSIRGWVWRTLKRTHKSPNRKIDEYLYVVGEMWRTSDGI